MAAYHLAQVNIGRFRAPLESPIMEGFRRQLDPINALADGSPGFVWRLQTEDGNATAIRPYKGDDLMAINMSVWQSFEALQQFVYKSHHVETLRARQQWFEAVREPDSCGSSTPSAGWRASIVSTAAQQSCRRTRRCMVRTSCRASPAPSAQSCRWSNTRPRLQAREQ
jgi:uncharacterized protein DUF3291